MPELTKSQLLFGREPALWASIAQALVAVVAGFLVPLTTEQAGVLVGVVNALIGVLLALKVRPIAPAAFTAFVQAALAVAVAFGLDLTADQQGVLLTATSLLITAVLVRPAVSPKAYPVVDVQPETVLTVEYDDPAGLPAHVRDDLRYNGEHRARE